MVMMHVAIVPVVVPMTTSGAISPATMSGSVVSPTRSVIDDRVTTANIANIDVAASEARSVAIKTRAAG
jgi:hypothetical protein